MLCCSFDLHFSHYGWDGADIHLNRIICISFCIKRWFSTAGDFAPWGHLAIARHIFLLSQLEGSATGITDRSYNLQGSPLTTKDYLPENSVVPRLKNSIVNIPIDYFSEEILFLVFFLIVRNALWGSLPLFTKTDTPTYWTHSREALLWSVGQELRRIPTRCFKELA